MLKISILCLLSFIVVGCSYIPNSTKYIKYYNTSKNEVEVIPNIPRNLDHSRKHESYYLEIVCLDDGDTLELKKSSYDNQTIYSSIIIGKNCIEISMTEK